MNITIAQAVIDDAETLLALQKEAFQPLHEIYQDENNPVFHNLERINQRIATGSFFKIMAEDVCCGGIFIYQKQEGLYRLNTLFVAPSLQCKGIGQRAIALAEQMVPDAVEWELDYHSDQIKNRKCYENAGYIDKHIRQTINERLTLTHMHKFVPPCRLVVPNNNHKAIWQDFQEACKETDGKVIPFAARMGDGTFEGFLNLIQEYATGHFAPERAGHVQSTTYFLLDNTESRLIGCISIRHALNEMLLQIGGHIGYGVHPLERRKGYATKMLALALDECRALGLDRVLVTCDKDNIGSARTIQRNGGVLENEYAEDDGNIVQRYWIAL